MRVLVTGATGFVGTRLTRYLRECGDEVAGTFVGGVPADPTFDPFEADIVDGAALSRVIREWEPEAIIHLAGLSHVGSSWEQVSDYFQVNVLGTRMLLEAAGSTRVVLASSAEVYGLVPGREQPIREDRALDPRNPYAMSKAAAELLAIDAGAVVARSFNLIGPGQSPTFALPSFAQQLAAIERGESGRALKVGNLEARRDFLHVDDALDGYRLLATRGLPGEAYNLGSGEAHSIREVLDRLLELSGVEAWTEMDPSRFRPVDVPLTCADVGKLRQLGWTPRLDVDRAIRDLWADASS
jgi:GDP-4-dehydro-6-deoxy-D-mannose reductase